MVHVPQNELLAAKAAEVQSLLETWAKEEGVLTSGQQIVFSMKIVDMSLVVQDGSGSSTSVMDMQIMSLLSMERLMRYSNRSVASRVRRQLSFEANGPMTVREFLAKYPNQRKLEYLPNLGKGSSRAAACVLQDAGIVFHEL